MASRHVSGGALIVPHVYYMMSARPLARPRLRLYTRRHTCHVSPRTNTFSLPESPPPPRREPRNQVKLKRTPRQSIAGRTRDRGRRTAPTPTGPEQAALPLPLRAPNTDWICALDPVRSARFRRGLTSRGARWVRACKSSSHVGRLRVSMS
jgi:hypothetical protein